MSAVTLNGTVLYILLKSDLKNINARFIKVLIISRKSSLRVYDVNFIISVAAGSKLCPYVGILRNAGQACALASANDNIAVSEYVWYLKATLHSD
jgi:hypothetical protein